MNSVNIVCPSGWWSFLQTEQDRYDYTNQNNTPKQEQNEAQYMSGKSQNRNIPLYVFIVLHDLKKTFHLV